MENAQATPVLAATRSFSQIIQKDPLYNQVHDVLLWKDPITSGLTFGIVNLFFLLITYCEYSVITLISYFFETLIIAGFGYTMYFTLIPRLQGKSVPPPLKEKVNDAQFSVSAESLKQHAETVADLINLCLDHLKDAVVCADLLVTARLAAFFYFVATLGDWFSGAALLYFVSFVAFVWPRLYQEKKAEIDAAVEKVVDQANVLYEQGKARLPPNIKDKLPNTLFPKKKHD